MKIENENINEPQNPQLNIGAVSVSISDIAMNWWHDLSDYKTDELIMKYKMTKPIREEKIIQVYNLEVGG